MRTSKFSLRRFVVWTVIIASIHRIGIAAIGFLGFYTVLQGIGPNHPHAGENGQSLWNFAAALDYPIEKLNLETTDGMITIAQIIWSLILGLIVAALICRFERISSARSRKPD